MITLLFQDDIVDILQRSLKELVKHTAPVTKNLKLTALRLFRTFYELIDNLIDKPTEEMSVFVFGQA